MTEENPGSPSGTPLWQPSGTAPAPAPGPLPFRSPYQQAPMPYQPPAAQPGHQLGLAPYPRAASEQRGAPVAFQPIVPSKPTPLPIEPKRHSQFLQTPRRRWWKLPVALVVASVAWLVGALILYVPAIVYDFITQRVDPGDSRAVTAFARSLTDHMTPAMFLANNVGIVLMIPCAWLGLVIYGQPPRWLSSVVGGLRWRWLFRILGLLLLPYLALEVLTVILGGLPALSWKPYSVFMIIVILLTTPLQCAGEEYGFRGLINRLFGSYGSSRVSFWIGGIVSSVVFMILHSAQDILLNVFYFSFGMLSCWMAWRTGGLEAGIAMHVVNNMSAMAVLPFSDLSGLLDRQTGSAHAMDVLPLAAVMVVCMGLVEWQVRRRKPVAVAAPGAVAPLGA